MLLSDQKCTILVGEDEAGGSELILRPLSSAWAIPWNRLATGRGAGVPALGESAIAAVLLDIVMMNRDGLDTLREIRNLDRQLRSSCLSGASSTLNVVPP